MINQAILQKNQKGDSKEAQIKKSFAKTLDMYPTENLEDFYDKEDIEMENLKRRQRYLGY